MNPELVPYISQWESPELVSDILAGVTSAAADPRWRSSGATSRKEYEFWSWRTCGVACLRMLIAAGGEPPPPVMSLVGQLIELGGYRDVDGEMYGLYYAPLVELVRRNPAWRIDAEVAAPLSTAFLGSHLADGGTAIVSVSAAIRDALDPSAVAPVKRGGHLVLALALRDDAIILHNPSGRSSTSQSRFVVPVSTFDEYFAGRGVLISDGRSS